MYKLENVKRMISLFDVFFIVFPSAK